MEENSNSTLEKTIQEYYFNDNTQKAIIQYNNSSNGVIKNKLYKDYIQIPFEKLAEFTIYEGQYFKMNNKVIDLKHEVIAYLLEQLHLYTENKGRAFSYFNVICRNYFKKKAKEQYQKSLLDTVVETADTDRGILIDSINKINNSDDNFINCFIEHIDKHLEYYFKKPKEQDIANSILIILRHRESIEDPNKKHLYLFIREITDAKTYVITKIVNIMKFLYVIMKNEYISADKISKLDADKVKELQRNDFLY